MAYIVEFPDLWYLRGTVATGDLARATRYPSENDARKALAQARHYFKAKAIKAAKIVPEDDAAKLAALSKFCGL